MFARTHCAQSRYFSRNCSPHYQTVLPNGVFCILVCRKNFMPHHRKIVVIWCNFKRFYNILNSEILLNLIRKMKCLTDQFQLCFLFALATLNSSDVVETVTFETETSSKLRDRGFIKNSETETS